MQPRGGDGVTITIDWSKATYKGELLSPTVICFADIPFDCLPTHTAKYGKFGLAFGRDLLITMGARPVTYMPYDPREIPQPTIGRGLIDRLIKASRDFDEQVIKDKSFTSKRAVIEELWTVLSKDMLAFLKVFNRTLEDDSPFNYSMEREWRMYTALEFVPEWVQEVIVARELVAKARADFPQYADRIYHARGKKP